MTNIDPMPEEIEKITYSKEHCHFNLCIVNSKRRRLAWNADVQMVDAFNPSIGGTGNVMSVIVAGGDGHEYGTSDWAVYEEERDPDDWHTWNYTRRTDAHSTRRLAIEAFLPTHNRERHHKMVAHLAANKVQAERDAEQAVGRRRRERIEAAAPSLLAALKTILARIPLPCTYKMATAIRKAEAAVAEAEGTADPKEWSGSPDPCDPDHAWINDKTGERIPAEAEESQS